LFRGKGVVREEIMSDDLEKTSLSLVKVNETVRLNSVDAGHGLRSRLASMGLVSGVEFEVLKNTFRGPMLVSIKGSRLMLGRGMADKILVELCEANKKN